MPIFITKFSLWATVLNSTGIFFGQSLCIIKFWRSWLAQVGSNYRGSFSLNPIWVQIRGLGTGAFAGLLVCFFCGSPRFYKLSTVYFAFDSLQAFATVYEGLKVLYVDIFWQLVKYRSISKHDLATSRHIWDTYWITFCLN